MNERPTDSPETTAPAPPRGPEEAYDLRRHLVLLWRRRALIVAFSVLALAAGVLYLRRAVPIYAATATLRFNRAAALDSAGIPDDTLGFSYDVFRTQIEQISSPAVAIAVLDSLNIDTLGGAGDGERASLFAAVSRWVSDLSVAVGRHLVTYEDAGLDPAIKAQQRRWQQVLDRLSVKQRPDTLLVDVTFRCSDRKLASRIADEFCAQYVALTGEGRLDVFSTAQLAVSNRLEEAKRALKLAEQALFDYQKRVNLQVMDASVGIAQTEMAGISAEIDTSRKKIIEMESYLAEWDSIGSWVATTEGDHSLQTLEDALVQLRLKEFELSATNTGENPELLKIRLNIQALSTEIADTREELRGEEVGKVEAEYGRLAALEQLLSQKADTVQGIQALLLPYKELERDAATSRDVYETLLGRVKQIDLANGFAPQAVSILSNSTVPEFADSPKKAKILFLFLLLGLFGGVGTVYLLEAIDRTVKSPLEIETRYNLPSLGLVPFLGGDTGLFARRLPQRLQLVSREKPQSPEAEAFRYVRTAIQYSSSGARPGVILVTSCMPSEGKSTAAANLALTIAGRGERTLLIDADLKKPSLHRALGQGRQPGLTDALTGNEPVGKCIVKGAMEALDFLPAGTAAPAPVDLLDSATMSDLLSSLREEYPWIIIDSAPLEGMADSFVLARKVDGMCLVIRHASTRKDVLHRVLTTLHSIRARVLGTIYNCPVKEGGDAGIGYGYGAYGTYGAAGADAEKPGAAPG